MNPLKQLTEAAKTVADLTAIATALQCAKCVEIRTPSHDPAGFDHNKPVEVVFLFGARKQADALVEALAALPPK